MLKIKREKNKRELQQRIIKPNHKIGIYVLKLLQLVNINCCDRCMQEMKLVAKKFKCESQIFVNSVQADGMTRQKHEIQRI